MALIATVSDSMITPHRKLIRFGLAPPVERGERKLEFKRCIKGVIYIYFLIS